MTENTDPHNGTAGELFKLVTKVKHRFPLDVKQVSAEESYSGHPQTERTCELCGAVKVTVHEGSEHYRAWRTNEHAEQVVTMEAPACVPTKDQA